MRYMSLMWGINASAVRMGVSAFSTLEKKQLSHMNNDMTDLPHRWTIQQDYTPKMHTNS